MSISTYNVSCILVTSHTHLHSPFQLKKMSLLSLWVSAGFFLQETDLNRKEPLLNVFLSSSWAGARLIEYVFGDSH